MFGTTRLRHGASRVGLRRRILASIAVAALGVAGLTGCAAGQISQTADQVPNHDGAHGTVGQVGVSNAVLGDSNNSAGPVAFKSGSDVPLALWVTNDAGSDDTLTSISTSAGDVTLSGTATVPARGSLQIGGDSDVAASISSTTSDIAYGFPITVDFYFENAGKLTLQLSAAIPVQRGTDRQSTDIYPTEETNLWHEPISDNG